MSYTDETLTKDEKVLLRAKIALQRYWPCFILGGMCLFGGIVSITAAFFSPGPAAPTISVGVTNLVIGALFLVPPYLRRWTNELVLTNKRVVAKIGLVSLQTIELKLEKVESVSVKQGLFGKLLNYGTVEVTGTGASHALIKGVSNPISFRKYFGRATEGIA